MIKFAALDLDGTLLASDHLTIPSRNVEAIVKAKKKGVIFSVASGRTLGILPDVIEKNRELFDYFIVSNGAAVYDKVGVRLYDKLIPYDVWCEIYNMLKDFGCAFEMYADGAGHIDEDVRPLYKTDYLSPHFVKWLQERQICTYDMPSQLRNMGAEKFSVLSTPKEFVGDLSDGLSAIERQFGVKFTTCSSIPGNIEINIKPVSKGNALSGVCDKLGIAPAEVLAMGDSGNDAEMLKFAGVSVAMANASDDVKAAAKFVGLSNDDCGVADAIEKYCDLVS